MHCRWISLCNSDDTSLKLEKSVVSLDRSNNYLRVCSNGASVTLLHSLKIRIQRVKKKLTQNQVTTHPMRGSLNPILWPSIPPSTSNGRVKVLLPRKSKISSRFSDPNIAQTHTVGSGQPLSLSWLRITSQINTLPWDSTQKWSVKKNIASYCHLCWYHTALNQQSLVYMHVELIVCRTSIRLCSILCDGVFDAATIAFHGHVNRCGLRIKK